MIYEEIAKTLTPEDIHKLADFAGIPWDNDPNFLALTKQITGKEHLDQLGQAGLRKMYIYLRELKRPIESKLKKRIAASLRSRGYRIIGTGTDAIVWMRDSGSVAKIIISDYGQHRAIESARALHDLAHQYPNLPNLPRYVSINGKTIEEFDVGGIPFLRMNIEQLKPMPRGGFHENLIWRFSDGVERKLSWNKVMKNIAGEISDLAFRDKVIKASPLEKKRWELLYETMSLLYNLGRKNSFSWDLHTENVMLRPSTDEIVINDPWA